MKNELWITNISKMNISLSDLNLTIKSLASINLLDEKHYHYTLEQIEKSIQSGSIFKRRDKIFVRINAPDLLKNNMSVIRETYIPSRKRSLFEMKVDHYDELDVSDEQFAEENADTADFDTKPLILKG
jgi:hypothetical protein